MTQPSNLHLVRIRAFDGTYEVLRKRDMLRELDTTPAALNTILPNLLAQLAREARQLENEPMSHPRLEVWTADGRTRLHDYSGGWL